MIDGYRLHHFETLDSTNDRAKQMARDGASAGHVIIADQQTKGRGRQGNQWHSPQGNLYMSVILRETVGAINAGQLSFLSAVALADVVAPLLKQGLKVEQKWPNDVWISGQKLAGILLESEGGQDSTLEWIVMGIGVNIVTAPEGAVSLQHSCDDIIETIDLGRLFINSLETRLSQWRKNGFAGIRDAWLENARGLGTAITVRLPNQEFSGVFQTVDEQGCLMLELSNGALKKIASGDVFFS